MYKQTGQGSEMGVYSTEIVETPVCIGVILAHRHMHTHLCHLENQQTINT